MLLLLFVILLLVWGGGMLASVTMGGLIHVLLIVALISLVFHFVGRRRVA